MICGIFCSNYAQIRFTFIVLENVWTNINGKKYHIHIKEETYSNALAICKSMGGSLITGHSYGLNHIKKVIDLAIKHGVTQSFWMTP